MRETWKAFLISISLSIVLALIAWGLGESGFPTAARVLLWPSAVLQALVVGPNIGTESQPLYEATPIHVVAFYAGLGAQVPIYWVAIYAVLRAKIGRST